MSIAVIAEIPGGNAQFDEEMLSRLGLEASPPPGALARFSGPTEAGWRVVSVWESREAWETFRRDRLEPALRETGRQPQFELWELNSVRMPASQTT